MNPFKVIIPTGEELGIFAAYGYANSSGNFEMLDFIEKMLDVEGWQEDQGLPFKWMFKNDKFVSDDGILFESVDSAVKHLKNQARYTDMGLLKSWRSKLSLKWTIEGNSLDDRKLMFSNKLIFHSVAEALRYLLVNKYPNLIEVKMRSYMKEDGWENDAGLPFDWMLRKMDDNGRLRRFEFINERGILFKSSVMAFEYMEQCRKYSPDQKRNVYKIMCLERTQEIDGEFIFSFISCLS